MLGRRIMIGWLPLATMIALPLILSAETPPFQKPQIAIVEVGAGRIDWLPQVDYESLVVTIAGPANLYLHYEFGPGQASYLSLIDAKGDRLPDGTYAYELRTVPRLDRESRERLSRPRETGDKSPREELQRGSRPPAEALVQSGFFSIRDGSFVQGSRRTGTKPSKPPLQSLTEKLVDDDLVIQGNACIGSECASNGNDYSVLKLNAIQPNILFDDVEPIGSSSSAFNDWALFINPFNAAQFAIADFEAQTVPFSVIGGAPDNSLLISENGNVGLGTATPGTKLHMFASATADIFGSAGPDPVSGPAFNFGYGGFSFGRGAGFLNVRPDASATAPNPSLRFMTANVERMIITNSGRVGIGTANPESILHIATGGVVTIGGHTIGERSDNVQDLHVKSLRNTLINVDSDNNSTNASFAVFRDGNLSSPIFIAREDHLVGVNILTPTQPFIVGTNSTNGNGAHVTAAGVWTNGSSRVSKKNIQMLTTEDAFAALGGLEPVRYTGKSSSDGEEYLGFIAEDVPDLVAMNNRQSLSPMDIVAVLTKVVQEQQKTIEKLSARLADLESVKK